MIADVFYRERFFLIIVGYVFFNKKNRRIFRGCLKKSLEKIFCAAYEKGVKLLVGKTGFNSRHNAVRRGRIEKLILPACRIYSVKELIIKVFYLVWKKGRTLEKGVEKKI